MADERCTIDLPIGTIALHYQNAPLRLRELVLPHNFSGPLAHPAGSPHLPPELKEIAGRLGDYFKGHPLDPMLHLLDLSGLTPLMQAVSMAVCRIPHGRTASYGAIAAAVGRPLAARFVGSVMARNPFPLLIPCHRVVLGSGALGQYGGGRQLKQYLLDLELEFSGG